MASFLIPSFSSVTSTAPFRQSATYVVAEPTITHIKPSYTYSHSAAYISMRIMTVGGLTLLLIGLCCLAAVLLRFSRYERRAIHMVDNEKAMVIDQTKINKHFPIRIYPSNQRLFVNNDDMVVAMLPSETRLDLSVMERRSPSLQHHQAWMTEDLSGPEKPLHPPHTFMSFGLASKLWSRDSSRCTSRCNSPSPSQLHRMSGPVSSAIVVMPPMDKNESITKVDTVETDSDELCSICLGEYMNDDRIRILPCGHEYHAECVDVWLTHKSTHCPLCKHNLLDDIFDSKDITLMQEVVAP